MRKKICAVTLTSALVLGMSISAMAAGWEENAIGTRWQNDDGSYLNGTWAWLDDDGDGIAECYYFNPTGYLMKSCMIDGYQINSDGHWVVSGEVQTLNLGAEEAAAEEVQIEEEQEEVIDEAQAAAEEEESAEAIDEEVIVADEPQADEESADAIEEEAAAEEA